MIFRVCSIFLIVMFVVVVVGTLVLSRLLASSTEENAKVNGIDVNLSRVLNSQVMVTLCRSISLILALTITSGLDSIYFFK